MTDGTASAFASLEACTRFSFAALRTSCSIHISISGESTAHSERPSLGQRSQRQQGPHARPHRAPSARYRGGDGVKRAHSNLDSNFMSSKLPVQILASSCSHYVYVYTEHVSHAAKYSAGIRVNGRAPQALKDASEVGPA